MCTIGRVATAHLRGSVLVVDDEPTIAEVVSRYLERAGYETRIAARRARGAGRRRRARARPRRARPHAAGLDGLEVMRRMRERRPARRAIILLTAQARSPTASIGLRLGADDYVVKPFSPAELVARVDAVLRRIDTVAEQRAAAALRRARDRPGRPARAPRRRGGRADQREFDLLLFLARHPGQAFTRDQLMDQVWRYSFYTDTSTVTVHIRRLRAKIEGDPAQPRFIETVWGVGYRFAP